MTSHFQTYQQRVPIGVVQKDGSVLASEAFSRFISLHVYNRIGGIDALTNLELAEIVDAAVARAQQGLLGVLQVAQRPPRGGVAIDVTQDAAGVVIDVVVEELIAGIMPYLPRSVAQRGVDDAQAIIASQSFGGR